MEWGKNSKQFRNSHLNSNRNISALIFSQRQQNQKFPNQSFVKFEALLYFRQINPQFSIALGLSFCFAWIVIELCFPGKKPLGQVYYKPTIKKNNRNSRYDLSDFLPVLQQQKKTHLNFMPFKILFSKFYFRFLNPNFPILILIVLMY